MLVTKREKLKIYVGADQSNRKQSEELMVLFFSHFLQKRCFQDFELEMLGANEELLGLKKLSERLRSLIY